MLVKTGEMVQAQAMMHKAVVQTVLLYWSDSWVVRDVMLKVLEELHHQLARKIVGISDQQI